jgi:hypothetical protein
VPFWSTYTVFYTYFDVLFYVCMYFEENTGPIRMHTDTAQNHTEYADIHNICYSYGIQLVEYTGMDPTLVPTDSLWRRLREMSF